MIAKLAASGTDLIDRPYDGVDRYVLDGELRENPSGAIDPETGDIMPVRNIEHSEATAATTMPRCKRCVPCWPRWPMPGPRSARTVRRPMPRVRRPSMGEPEHA